MTMQMQLNLTNPQLPGDSRSFCNGIRTLFWSVFGPTDRNSLKIPAPAYGSYGYLYA